MYGECWFTGKIYFKHGGSQNATLKETCSNVILNMLQDTIFLAIQTLADIMRPALIQGAYRDTSVTAETTILEKTAKGVLIY